MHSPFEDQYETTFWARRRRTAMQTETKRLAALVLKVLTDRRVTQQWAEL